VFKFVSKGDTGVNEAALFYNGQRLYTMSTVISADGEIDVQAYNGEGVLCSRWEDYLEDYEYSD
jgi:hypothetical protein